MLLLVVGNEIISDIGRCAQLCTAKKKLIIMPFVLRHRNGSGQELG